MNADVEKTIRDYLPQVFAHAGHSHTAPPDDQSAVIIGLVLVGAAVVTVIAVVVTARRVTMRKSKLNQEPKE